MRTLRVTIAALIWASALATAAQAEQALPNPASDAASAVQISYRYPAPDAGPTTPGPTDPNGPST